MLADCLSAIARQRLPERCQLHLVVVDNEPEPNNEEAVKRFAERCPFPVRYVHEPRRGIPQARNAVLDACENRADWIAFTDDDCVPTLDWIAALLAAARRHSADVVYGRREFVPPEPTPFWYAPPDSGRRIEGQALDYAATHNVLMAGELAGLRFRERHVGLRFDERLAHGEDSDFFWRASQRFGARIVYSAAPVVYETVPPHRATLRYQMKRAFHFAASRTSFRRRYHGFDNAIGGALARLLWQVPVSAVRLLLVAPLLLPFSRQRFKRHVLKSAGRLVGAAGTMAGLAGWNGNPYA
jgi:succinoglycan biosynthesis protein ExoM